MINAHPSGALLRALLLAVAAASLAACSGDDSSAPSPPAPSVPSANAVAASEAPPDDERIREVAAHFDPSLSGWDTESFHDSAKRRLKELGHLLDEGHATAGDLAGLVEADARIDELRPPKPAVVHEAAPITVRRVGETETTAGTGATGLAAALAGLLRPFEGLPVPHPRWKIIRVELDGARGSTFLRVETSSQSPKRALQQVSHWLVSWSLGSGEDGLRIAGIDALSLDEVEVDGGRLLTDATRAVLTDEKLAEDLRPGISELWGRTETAFGLHAYGHHGLAIGDANGDGLEDLYVLRLGGRPNALLLQQPDGSVHDATEESGAGFLDWSLAALFLDLDGDGDEDLVVSMNPGVLLLENDGEANFHRRGFIGMRSQPGHLSAADYDGDGDVDLHVCRYAGEVSVQLGQRSLPVPYHDANNGATNALLRNDGDFVFTDVTEIVGLAQNGTRFSFAAAWEDFDDDGDPDLYVANDFGRNNLYRNDGGRFRDVAAEAGVEDISAGMGVTWGDVDGDGRADLHVSNMFSSAGNRIAYQRRFRAGGDQGALDAMRRHARGNSLFRNLGDGSFEDLSVESGITMGRWAWGAEMVDLDLDGREDLVVVNGFVSNDDTKDL